MSPEELERMLAEALEALAEGVPLEHINMITSLETDGEIQTLAELQARLAPTGPAATPAPSPDPAGRPMGVRDFLTTIAHGLSFGARPELAGMNDPTRPSGRGFAGLSPVTAGMEGGQSVGDPGSRAPGGPDAERAAREDIHRIRQDHPVGSFVGEAIGSVGVPAFGGARMAAGATARGFGRLGSGIAGGAGAGAAGGAVYGGLEGIPDPQDPGAAPSLLGRAGGAVMGGVAGGLFGGALGAAGAGLRRLFTPVEQRAADRAQANYARALRDAGIPEAEIPARLQALGEGSVPADLSDSLAREARAAVNQAASLARPGGPVRRIDARTGERGERMAARLREEAQLNARSLDESLQMAEAHKRAVREEFYRPLEEAFPTVSSPQLQALLRHDPEIKALVKRFDIDPDNASLRQLQDILITLRETMNPGSATVLPGQSRMAKEAHDAFEAALSEAVPGFAAAQQSMAQAFQRIEAHELGQRLAIKPVREIREAFEGLTTDEARDAFRHGMLDRFERDLLESMGGGSRFNQIIKAGQGMRDRIRTIVGGDPELQRVLQTVEAENRWAATANALRGNSTSIQQGNDIHAQMPLNQSGILRSILARLPTDSPEERVMAAEILGRILLGEGEEAAIQAANHMILRQGLLSGGAGMAAGVGAVGELQPGGFFGPPPVELELQYEPQEGGAGGLFN